MLDLGPETIPGILMHLVAMSAGQEYPVTEQQAADQGRQAAKAPDRQLARENVGQGGAGVAG